MLEPHKMGFYHLINNWFYFNFLLNAFIPNPILPGVSTNPTQHSHHSYIEFILLLAFYRPTFSLVQDCKANSVKFSFKFEWDFSITDNTRSTHPFHPNNLSLMVYISLYFPTVLYIGPKVLKSCDLFKSLPQ